MTRREHIASLFSSLALAETTKLKLTRYELFSVRVPFAERVREAWIRSWDKQKRDQVDFTPTFVRLHTDAGVSGIGDTKLPRTQAEAILKKMMGRSPMEFLHDDSLRGILIAIYDLLGKAAGQPVAKLLSANARKAAIPTWWSQCFPPALMASEAKLGYSLGYRVHKVKARPWEDPIAQAEAISAAIGKDMKVWADANSTWETVDKTIDTTRQLAKIPQYFAIESPIPRTDIDGYRKLKAKLPLKVSEHVDNIDLDLWTKEKLLDAWIVGAGKVGQYVKSLSSRAEAAQVPIWIEHSIDNGIAQVFQCHQVAAYPGLQYSISVTHVLEDDCMKEPFTVRKGYFHIPEKPGLGVSLDMDAIEKYRYSEPRP